MANPIAVNDYYLKVQALSLSDASTANLPPSADIASSSPNPIILLVSFVATLFIGFSLIITLRYRQFSTLSNALKLALILCAIPIGYSLFHQGTQLGTKASPADAPTNVIISSVTASSFTVSWETTSSNRGMVRYSPDPNLSENLILFANKKPAATHEVTVTNLKSNTPYFLELFSSGHWYNQNGTSIRVKTAKR